MSDETVSAIRARLRFESLDEFIGGYARYISAGGMFIPMSATKLKPKGSTIRFQFLLSDGATALLGEGLVHKVHEPDPNNPGSPVGLLVRFTKLSQSSKRVVDRVLKLRRSAPSEQADAAEVTEHVHTPSVPPAAPTQPPPPNPHYDDTLDTEGDEQPPSMAELFGQDPYASASTGDASGEAAWFEHSNDEGTPSTSERALDLFGHGQDAPPPKADTSPTHEIYVAQDTSPLVHAPADASVYGTAERDTHEDVPSPPIDDPGEPSRDDANPIDDLFGSAPPPPSDHEDDEPEEHASPELRANQTAEHRLEFEESMDPFAELFGASNPSTDAPEDDEQEQEAAEAEGEPGDDFSLDLLLDEDLFSDKDEGDPPTSERDAQPSQTLDFRDEDAQALRPEPELAQTEGDPHIMGLDLDADDDEFDSVFDGIFSGMSSGAIDDAFSVAMEPSSPMSPTDSDPELEPTPEPEDEPEEEEEEEPNAVSALLSSLDEEVEPPDALPELHLQETDLAEDFPEPDSNSSDNTSLEALIATTEESIHANDAHKPDGDIIDALFGEDLPPAPSDDANSLPMPGVKPEKKKKGFFRSLFGGDN
ncbi:MAG: hypothetical protein AAGI01_00365 [Myxococcota bacterium]